MTFEIHDLQAEEAALAAAVTNPAACAYLVERCREDDFQRSDSRSVLRAVATLHAAGRPVDPVTVSTTVCSGAEDDDAQRLTDYVGHLSESFVVAANVAEYVASIVGQSAKRRAILAGQAISEAALGVNGDLAGLPGILEGITGEAVREIRERCADEKAGQHKLKWLTGAELATMTPETPGYVLRPYLARGLIVQLTGKVKGGKTTLAMHMAAAVLHERPFLAES